MRSWHIYSTIIVIYFYIDLLDLSFHTDLQFLVFHIDLRKHSLDLIWRYLVFVRFDLGFICRDLLHNV